MAYLQLQQTALAASWDTLIPLVTETLEDSKLVLV